MGNVCSPRLGGGQFTLPDLRAKNNYGTSDGEIDDRWGKIVFPQTYEERRNCSILKEISDSSAHLFEDEHFQMNSKKSLRLSILFNYETNRTRIYSKREETDLTNFVQLNIELSYLTSVFYLLCNRSAKSELLPRLIENQETNNCGAYSTHLWCNGQHHNVIVDDRMPTNNDNFLFLRVVKGIQLWPLILQKAWVKMIGSYEAALGLSPEQSFEQITGAPAYTYTLRSNNREIIRSTIQKAVADHYWVALIARNGLDDIQNRQVFVLQSYDYNQYKIISPFVNYQFAKYSMTKRGQIVIQEDDLFSHFEHVVIGFYKEGYMPVSVPVTSECREELIFEMNVKREEEVSIRFNQLFHGYFKPQDRSNYEYSPILIELYEVNEEGDTRKCKLLDYCQGCSRALIGERSSQCCRHVMQKLKGKYLIKLEVDWLYAGALNSGNLVVYASENNVQIAQMPKNDEILFRDVYPDIFKHQGTNDIILHEHNLEVHTFDKEKTTLIEFHNITSATHHFQADFTKSKNVLLRGKEVSKDYAYIRLGPDEKTIVEVLPRDMRKHIEINNFEINKVPVKQ